MKEQICEYCRRLHLPVMAEQWSAIAKDASINNIPYSEFLFRLLEAEINAKQERSIQTLIKLSKLPYHKTIDTFDFTAQPSVDERRIRELLTLSFIDRKENILFLGPPGIGKTHLAISIGMEAIAKGYKTYFITAHDMVTQLRKADQEGKLEKKLRVFVKPTVLIIDEVGYLKLNPNGAHYIFQVIARRYEQAPIILTSNKGFGEWGEMMGDTVLATAILDRLLHHSIIFNLKGESYRLRDKKLQQQEKQKD